MSDRALLFLVSLCMVAVALAAAIWLITTGQVGTFDGNFLLLSCIVIGAAFALYLRFLIRRAMETPAASKPPSPAEKKAASPERELVGKV